MASSLSPFPFKPHSSASVSSPSTNKRRPAVILPGLGNNTGDHQKLQTTLRDYYGVPTVVADVSRLDWFRNAAGLVDHNYWRGTLQPRPVFDWYFKSVNEAIADDRQLAQGGWLARIYMEEFGFSDISLLLTLGTPHLSPSKELPGVIDQTRGLLDYVEKRCTKAVYTPQLNTYGLQGGIFRVLSSLETQMLMLILLLPDLVVAINTDQQTSEVAIVNNKTNPTSVSTYRARIVGHGYKQVCWQADVWGDGVVPEASAHLEGALNISLDGVYHSPVGSDNALTPWHGSPAVVEKWKHHLLT